MELLTFLSTYINNLYSQKKKFLVSDAVSDYIRSPFNLTKKSIAPDAVSDLTLVVIVLLFLSCCGCLAKIVGSCCGCLAKIVGSCCGCTCLAWSVRSGCGCLSRCLSKSVKTMKAPGRNYHMPRSNFEANPSAYFRDLRKG
uniref:Uncharacterized protein n=1 Tax=Populus trichocarpa TaxID=3694 RepID=A0A2K1WTD0_POPTR